MKLVLQRLLENRLYVKAEKCEFHVSSVSFLGFVVEKGQLKTDPAKVLAVAEWPTPTTRKQLQRFLGFANFYRRFIRDYSRVAAPLTKLTSVKAPFVWSPAADAAYVKLKCLFSSAPVLSHPDPAVPFVVEVDASDSGVGAVLSQRTTSDQKLHPCAFFSRRLTPAERNYDVGNRELLAVVLALQEWRHWLEGSTHPFVVWTDHKNLSYLRSARRLNSRQARWALFLGRFTSHSPTGRVPGMSSPMPCHVSSPLQLRSPLRTLSCLLAVWWERPGGRLKGWSRQPKRTIQLPRVVHRTGCSCLRLPDLQCSSGDTLPRLRAIQVFVGPWLFCSKASGGPPCPLTRRSTSLPAPSAPAVRLPTGPLLASFAPFPFLTGLGLTSLWILSQACPPQKVIQPF